MVVAVATLGLEVEEAMSRAEKTETKQLQADTTAIEQDVETAGAALT